MYNNNKMKKILILLLIIGFNCKSQYIDSLYYIKCDTILIVPNYYMQFDTNKLITIHDTLWLIEDYIHYDTSSSLLLVSDTTKIKYIRSNIFIDTNIYIREDYDYSCYYIYGYIIWDEYLQYPVWYLDDNKKRITDLVIWDYRIINK